MNPSRLAEMFECVVATPIAERAAWLYRHCCDDPALRAQLESLLRAHDQAEGFMELVPADLTRPSRRAARALGIERAFVTRKRIVRSA